ncbi:MAG TPA: hypothetical protein VEW90_00070 [Gaiellaceae bacterium]|nr:hypothetical protein [Gaiellaceae bacterium]
MGRQLVGTIGVAVTAAVLVGCGLGQPAKEVACGKAVLSDWADGRIDQEYPAPCYEAAIEVMPEDIRAYTSARDDISRALYSHREGR